MNTHTAELAPTPAVPKTPRSRTLFTAAILLGIVIPWLWIFISARQIHVENMDPILFELLRVGSDGSFSVPEGPDAWVIVHPYAFSPDETHSPRVPMSQSTKKEIWDLSQSDAFIALFRIRDDKVRATYRIPRDRYSLAESVLLLAPNDTVHINPTSSTSSEISVEPRSK